MTTEISSHVRTKAMVGPVPVTAGLLGVMDLGLHSDVCILFFV